MEGRDKGEGSCLCVGYIDTCYLAQDTEYPCAEYADKYRALDLFDVKHGHDEQSDKCKDGAYACGVEVFAEVRQLYKS